MKTIKEAINIIMFSFVLGLILGALFGYFVI